MTTPVFPSIERLLSVVFLPLVGGNPALVGSETPPNLHELPYFIRSVRLGGDRDAVWDYPTVDVSCFAPDELVGWPLANAAADLLLSRPPPHPAIDLVLCNIGPREVPWGDDDGMRRWDATFDLELRRTRLPATP